MGGQPARRSAPRYAPPQPGHRPSSSPAARAARTERRRRQRHIRQLRRDMLVDVSLAILLTVAAISVTAGLGVIAIIELPVACAVIGSFLVERVVRNRR
jgi:hypothetical protein